MFVVTLFRDSEVTDLRSTCALLHNTLLYVLEIQVIMLMYVLVILYLQVGTEITSDM